MKKSIFLFFAAILCAMSANAKTIYLKPNSNWTQANAWFAVCLCNGSESPNWHKMTKSTADPSIYQVEIADAKLDKTTNKNIIFVRMNPAKTALSWDSKWNQTGDLDITKLATNNCCAINDGQWDCGTNVTWSTYTPPTEPVKYTWTVAGTPASVFEVEWAPEHAANDMVEQADGTYKWEKTNIEFADESSTVKFKVCQEHAWAVAYPGGDYELNISGAGIYTITITFNAANNAVNATATKTAEYEGEAPTHTYSVVGSNADLFGTAWDPAVEANLMETADNVTYTWKKEGVTLMGNFEMKVVQDKAFSVSYPAQNKVVEITEPAIYTVSITFNATSHDIDVNLTNTGAAVIPPVKLYFVNTGNWTDLKAYVWADGGNPYKAWEESESMTDTGDDVYGFDVYSYEFPSNYNRIIFKGANDQKTSDDVAAYDAAKPYYCNGVWYASLSEIPAPESLTYTVTVPEGTEECWIAGQMNNWTLTKMNQGAAANQFTLDIVGAAIDHEYKYACKNDWAYAEVREADENGNSNRKAWAVSDEVTAWGKPVVYTYYLMGVNDDWATGIEMEVNTDAENEVMLTCQPVNGEVKIKRIGDDESVSWYGGNSLKTADGSLGTNTSTDGGDGNILLEEGIYNFYFDTADGKLWIAAATDCVTEPTTVTLNYNLTTDAITERMNRRYVTAEDATLGNVQIILPSFNTETTEYTDAFLVVGDETISGATATYTADAANNAEVYTATATSENGTTYNVTMNVTVPVTQEYTFFAMNGAEYVAEDYGEEGEPFIIYMISGEGSLNDETVAFDMSVDQMGNLEATINDVYVMGTATGLVEEEGYLWLAGTANDEGGNTYNIEMNVAQAVEEVEIVITENVDVTLENLKLEVMGNMAMVTAGDEELSFWLTLLETENYYGNYSADMFANIWYGDLSLQPYSDGVYNENGLVVSFISEPDADGNATKYNFTLTLKTITLTTGDNSEVIEDNIGATVNVKIERSFTANTGYYTLCVPFDMPASVIGKAYQISSITEHAAQGIDVEFTEVEYMLAGQPYLIKPKTIDNPIVAAVTISNSTPAAVTVAGEGMSITMQGMFNSDGETNGLYWVGNGGYLYNDNVSTNGLCAYFSITTSSGIAPRMRVVTGENVETGVEDIITTDAPVKTIVNGQIIIIRDGVKYNVQGQVIR